VFSSVKLARFAVEFRVVAGRIIEAHRFQDFPQVQDLHNVQLDEFSGAENLVHAEAVGAGVSPDGDSIAFKNCAAHAGFMSGTNSVSPFGHNIPSCAHQISRQVAHLVSPAYEPLDARRAWSRST
jgi:hypothetical protein